MRLFVIRILFWLVILPAIFVYWAVESFILFVRRIVKR